MLKFLEANAFFRQSLVLFWSQSDTQHLDCISPNSPHAITNTRTALTTGQNVDTTCLESTDFWGLLTKMEERPTHTNRKAALEAFLSNKLTGTLWQRSPRTLLWLPHRWGDISWRETGAAHIVSRWRTRIPGTPTQGLQLSPRSNFPWRFKVGAPTNGRRAVGTPLDPSYPHTLVTPGQITPCTHSHSPPKGE